MTPPDYTKLEAQTRQAIDKKLIEAGWAIQDKNRINLYEKLGVAVREMDTDTGPADYMLFIDGKACGILEAKREGTNLGEVYQQSRRYAVSNTKHIERWKENLPFTYEADVQGCTNVAGGRMPGATTNHEIRFCDWRDPYPRSRNLYHFHKNRTGEQFLLIFELFYIRDYCSLVRVSYVFPRTCFP